MEYRLVESLLLRSYSLHLCFSSQLLLLIEEARTEVGGRGRTATRNHCCDRSTVDALVLSDTRVR